jgi:hypothetical protein
MDARGVMDSVRLLEMHSRAQITSIASLSTRDEPIPVIQVSRAIQGATSSRLSASNSLSGVRKRIRDVTTLSVISWGSRRRHNGHFLELEQPSQLSTWTQERQSPSFNGRSTTRSSLTLDPGD